MKISIRNADASTKIAGQTLEHARKDGSRNTPPTKIFANIEETELLRKQNKLQGDPNWRDKKKYCRYHKDYDYDTSEFRDLKD